MFEKMQKDNMEARKSRDTVTANLLTTVISEAKMVGKDAGNREPSEDEVSAIVKKFLKGINESITLLEKDNRDTEKEKVEKKILTSYLPEPLSEEDLKKAIEEIISTLPEKSPKMMGQVMAALKEKYPNQFDGKVASGLAKNLLS
ncbi:MAG: GatB/YqeY domain-containing protein [Leptospirales bacterium]